MPHYRLAAATLVTLVACTGGGNLCQDSCKGCCDPSGFCQTGETAQACGAAGFLCLDCASQSLVCGAGSCVAPDAGTTGGGSGGGGGATGGGANGGGSATGGGTAGGTGGGSSCIPETNAQYCTRNAITCGPTAGPDNCLDVRNIVSCGTCGTGQFCSAGTCKCQPETNVQFCTRQAMQCGSVTADDNCGTSRTVSCGTCQSPATCTAGACTCTSETDTEFCARMGKSCGGSWSGMDNCSRQRTVLSCGTCSGGSQCTNGSCTCSETNPQFCTRLSANCGTLSGTDTCGNTRNVSSCGTCSGVNTCAGGGMANTCGCTPQSEATLCAARGKDCGTLTVTDNCGMTRTLNCGSCTGVNVCSGGGTSNVCGCTSETNSAFCARVGAQCGSVTAADNCGVTRSNVACGTCSSPRVCTASNQCVCTAETDAQFCTRLGKTCGSLTSLDNCGASRTATCGTCSAFQSCGGGGVSNVCGGYGEPMQPVCGGGFCWANPLPVGVSLNAVKTTPNGSNWVVGNSGTVLQWNGTTWRGWFALTTANLNAVWPFSDTDVWVVGANGTALHYDGTAWSTVTTGTTQVLSGLWGASDGTLWAVGASGMVLKRAAGGSFATQAAGSTATLRAVFGIGPDVWVAGDRVILRLTGGAWSSTTASYDLTGIWGASATDLWAVSGSGVMRFTGTAWASSTAAYGTAITGTSTTDVVVTGWGNHLYKFNGLSWAASVIDGSSTAITGLTVGSGGALLAVGEDGALYRQVGTTWYRLNKGIWDPQTSGSYSPRSYDLAVSSSDVVVVGADTQEYGAAFRCTLASGCSASGVGRRYYDLRRVAASGATNVWTLEGTRMYRSTGGGISLVATLGQSAVDVAPLSSTDVWAVGGDKTVHYDGTTWSTVPNPISSTSTSLYAIAGVSGSDVWAAGSTGTMLHYTGGAWSAANSGVTGSITQLRAFSSSAVFAAGAFGVISWNGSAWSPTGQIAAVTSLWAESASAFWIVEGGKAKRWSGGAAQDMTPWAPAAFSVTAVSGNGTDVWLVGPSLQLLQKL